MNSIWDEGKIREARKNANLTAQAASEGLGVTREYVSMIEGGSRQPSQKLVGKMAALYGVAPTYFLKTEALPSVS